jgi:hypothetical protein
MKQTNNLPHEKIDALVSTIIGWCERTFSQKTEPVDDVAFSDEWERKQIARELHWN